ncbi:unnamed protein product [Caenorhabditis auriculariae]|uniref:Uncharacterized protein n=1 Tax=Caenorhabditis auriculariae TaxID=2777116 RepID=A0A8S1HFG7_9PELO|nr:unnamed protein product [Caenorhabditis auriculariae]
MALSHEEGSFSGFSPSPPANVYFLSNESWNLCSEDKSGGMAPRCAVCDSPNASTLHFGGRSCKACAAFFRRTVSMSMEYQCIGTNPHASCRIHHELRMVCRQCRYVKCLHAGMKKELVQARREDVPVMAKARRGTRGVVVKKSQLIEHPSPPSAVFAEQNLRHTLRPLTPPTPRSDAEEIVFVEVNDKHLVEYEMPAILMSDECKSMRMQQVDDVYGSIPVSEDQSLSIYETDASCSSPVNSFDDVFLRRGPSLELEDDRIFSLVDHYIRMEASLHDRRKIMYTDSPIREIFDVVCECPFERRHLRMFNWQTFSGMRKPDFAMILDYVTSFPDFNVLNRTEKNVLYRMTCAVDTMISSAYYTYRLLVLFNGEYIPMDPLPMSGDEPNASAGFSSMEEFTKYKTIMTVKIRQWLEMAVPFATLNPTFEEFVLLKALTIWHISHYKLTEEGREVCARQRDTIINALHRVSAERGDVDPAERLGELILCMGYIVDQIHALTSSYVMITFFDIIPCDPRMQDILSFKY